METLGYWDVRRLRPDWTVQEQIDQLLLDSEGLVRPHPAATLTALDRDQLLIWFHRNAVYVYPTLELIDWLRGAIGSLPTIEVAAGNGALGRALGICRTDSGVQDSELGQAVYGFFKQPTTKPAPDVHRIDGVAAVKRYKPHTVLAAWPPVLARMTDPVEKGGCAWGIDEAALLRLARRYIVVGNQWTHRNKPILERKHETHIVPGIVSRGDPALDRIWIWRGLGLR